MFTYDRRKPATVTKEDPGRLSEKGEKKGVKLFFCLVKTNLTVRDTEFNYSKNQYSNRSSVELAALVIGMVSWWQPMDHSYWHFIYIYFFKRH